MSGIRRWFPLVAAYAGTPIALVALVCVVAWLGSLGSPALERTTANMLINLVVVVGIYVFVGNSGVLSFGHPAFMAIGAYTAGILVTPVAFKTVLVPRLPGFLADFALSPLAATVVAGVVAAACAAVLAVPLSRLTGLAAALGTFALLIIVNVVAKNWEPITNGAAGMSGIPTSIKTDGALVASCIVIACAFLFQSTRLGLRLRASREDHVAAAATGVAVGRHRGAALVVSAFWVGVGGALYAQFIGSINPDAFYLSITFITIAMLVVGGLTSLTGAVIGTLFISIVTELLRHVEDGIELGLVSVPARPGIANVVLAAIMLAVLVVRPRGISNGRELTIRRSR